MKRVAAGLLLAGLLLAACDSGSEDVGGNRYFLRLEGTTGLPASCTIVLITRSDTSSALFNGLFVPDEADLGVVLGAKATCSKEQEEGLLRLALFLEGSLVDTSSTSAAFGNATVEHP